MAKTRKEDKDLLMPIREEARKINLRPQLLGKSLCIPSIPQCKTNWCWVACAAMVLTYRKKEFGKQCELAAYGLDASDLDCCDGHPSGGPCDRPASDKLIKALYHCFQIRAELFAQIPPDEIIAEINDRSAPVEIGYTSSGFGRGASGHVVLVYGWQEDNGGVSFLIHNPLTQARTARASFALPGIAYMGHWDATWKGL